MTARLDPDPAADDVMDSLVQTSFTVMALLSQVAAAHDMSLTQLRVMAILRDRAPQMNQLAAHLGLERSSMSGLIDRAAKRGLVRRDTSAADGRAVHVSLTPEGQELVARVSQEISALIRPMTGVLNAADQKRLSGLLNRLLEA